MTGKIVGATIPFQYTTVFVANTTTGDIAGPAAVVHPDYTYTLAGMATQEVQISFKADNTNNFYWYPTPLRVTEGASIDGIDLVDPTTH